MRSENKTIQQPSGVIITDETPLAELILSYPQLILFLEYFEIFLPLHQKTVEQICAEHHIQPNLFIAFANLYTGKPHRNETDFQITDLPVIINFLKNTHHYYLNEIYPNIEQCIERIKLVNDFGEIKLVDKFFHDYFNEVREHLDYENNIAFPYILQLYESAENMADSAQSPEYSVTEYKEHHTDIEEKLDDLMNLLIRYLPPQNDQQERRRLFSQLVALNNDLNVHAAIEDLILVPLVEQLERQMKRKK